MAYRTPHTTIAIQDKVHAALRLYSGLYGRNISELADEALLRGLAQMAADDPAVGRAAAADRAIKELLQELAGEPPTP